MEKKDIFIFCLAFSLEYEKQARKDKILLFYF
jgi:hypothetical protein